ncbi:NAD-dependent epimerase/dehydratase family protein [Vagococcus hydrophili]|uniref:NAD(P)-dependent oxidoreductase n=1 Tax=Vagococcus hydrophili TaxID=2714947 RepID=A0A6G8AR33_9ENTE|nr:NAD(P)-dependent oxidoreductase [Vagococcus hydrophili]QIL47429.1 NAD(P)-dependent oxidoreductase [Vagococcus hydrophili]
MRVAISGGSGFIGQYLCKELLNCGMEPVILSRRENKYKNIETIKTDYTYSDLIYKLKNIDSFVHLASKRGNQGRIEEFHSNEVMTQTIFEVCKELKIDNIVNASTISVYSKQDELPWNECSTVDPELMYGVSKFSNECIANIYSKKHGMNIKNLRIAHVFGFNEKNNYMINKFMRLAYNKKQLLLNTPSISKREFIYVKDVARAIQKALLLESSGTYNIGSSIRLTNEEVANKINSVFKNENEVSVLNKEGSEGISASYMDNSKAIETLMYSSEYSFEDALKEIFTEMKELPNVPDLY